MPEDARTVQDIPGIRTMLRGMWNVQDMTDKPAPLPALDEQIAENLRRAFSQKLDEAVPDRFIDLLRQLKEQDGAARGARNG